MIITALTKLTIIIVDDAFTTIKPYCKSDNDCYMIGGKCNQTYGYCYLPIYTLEPNAGQDAA